MFKIGDRLKIIDTRGSSSATNRLNQVGTIYQLGLDRIGTRDRLCYLKMDIDGGLVSMCSYRFELYEEPMLEYDPKQQGDTDDDI